MTKFKKGDLVFSLRFGWIKIKSAEDNNIVTYPIKIDNNEVFTFDGKYLPGDIAPTLFTKEEALIKFPEFPLPKQKVKKILKGWVNIYPNGKIGQVLHFTKELAEQTKAGNVLGQIEMIGEYEAEE